MTSATEQVDALLALPLFRDVDDELLDGLRIEAAITDGVHAWEAGANPRAGLLRFADLADGEVVVAQGTLATSFVVVMFGQVQALQARSARDVYHHRDYGPGDWFGEITTLTDSPALASYRADGDTQVALVDARMFRRLYSEDDTFKERIDAGYRDSLPLHLRLSPLCKDLDEPALQALEREAELLDVEEGEVVIEADSPADHVYLVRTGAVACYVETAAGERTLAYYKGSATFGEHTLLGEGATWPASYKTLMQTSLVKLPKRAFQQLNDTSRRGLVRAANRLVGRDDAELAKTGDASDLGPRGVLDELFVMVERQSFKGGRALVIDRKKCVRCNLCVESCEAVHDDGIPRLSKIGTRVATDEMLITACYHCTTPQCMLSCDYAAIRRDPQGRVRFEYDLCVGCAGCIDGCPYGVIRLVEPKPLPAPRPTFLQSLPWIGHLFGEPPAPPPPPPQDTKLRSVGAGGKVSPVNGKTIKCDLCAGLPFEACVYNCPTTAILRKEPQELFDRRSR
ncbi:MAG TPA: cyclic nucleotide-binding domain-containing protein [bacterium]|nr:cyclic nucleotide-binding domain-containing protein [bacterium]